MTTKKVVFFLMNYKIDFALFQSISAFLFIITRQELFAYAWGLLAIAFCAGVYFSFLMRTNFTVFARKVLKT